MSYEYNRNFKVLSQTLRKDMTREEKHLWYDFLKLLPFDVKRQKVIGDFIVDFYIPGYNLAIELDGVQHDASENKNLDDERDAYFNSLGITVLRYPNKAIRNEFSFVCSDILQKVGLTFKDVVK